MITISLCWRKKKNISSANVSNNRVNDKILFVPVAFLYFFCRLNDENDDSSIPFFFFFFF